jgi:hypothetical protein
MNTISAKEIKRRGMSVLDELLTDGPVHVSKNNRPTYVVMREEDYARRGAGSGGFWMLPHAERGRRGISTRSCAANGKAGARRGESLEG